MGRGIFSFFLFIVAIPLFSDDINRPTAPTLPTQPVVSGSSENAGQPGFPALPGFPFFTGRDSPNNGDVYEAEKYDLAVTEAFPNGNTRNNVANTITNAQYIQYSNRTMAIKLSFRDGSEYIYHLRNPRSKIETGAGIFRETFDTIVQTGKQFLLEQYTSELTYNDNSIISFNLIGNSRVIVFLRFDKI